MEIATSVINIAELSDPATAVNILSDNEGLTEQVDMMNGRDFMDAWMQFVTDSGLTREYFDAEVKELEKEIAEKEEEVRFLSERILLVPVLG